MFDGLRDFLVTAALLPGLSATSGLAPVPISQPPWRGLLRVQTELGVRCTGFLIAADVAITAAHCLFLPRTGGFLQPGSIHVLLRYRFGHYDAHARVLRVVISPHYDPRRQPATAGLDRAVLVLARPLAPASDRVPIAASLPAVGAPLRLGGYGQDRDETATEGAACTVLAVTRDASGHALIVHDCAGTRGTSGAPLLARGPRTRSPDGSPWQAVGVQIEARVGAVGGVAAALGAAATGSGTASGR